MVYEEDTIKYIFLFTIKFEGDTRKDCFWTKFHNQATGLVSYFPHISITQHTTFKISSKLDIEFVMLQLNLCKIYYVIHKIFYVRLTESRIYLKSLYSIYNIIYIQYILSYLFPKSASIFRCMSFKFIIITLFSFS